MDADNDYPTPREFRKGCAGLMLYLSSLPGEVLVEDWEWTRQDGFQKVLGKYTEISFGAGGFGLQDAGFM